MALQCPYAVMGLQPDCTAKEIRSTFKKLALMRHPDKLVNSGGLTEAEATAQFQALNSAYEILSDPITRIHYDACRRREKKRKTCETSTWKTSTWTFSEEEEAWRREKEKLMKEKEKKEKLRKFYEEIYNFVFKTSTKEESKKSEKGSYYCFSCSMNFDYEEAWATHCISCIRLRQEGPFMNCSTNGFCR